MISKTLFMNIAKCPRYAGLFSEFGIKPKANDNEFAAYLDAEYTKVELLVGKQVEETFGGFVIYGSSMKAQKHMETKYQGETFHTYADVYQEDENTIRIFEVKSATDRHMFKGYQIKNGATNFTLSFSPADNQVYTVNDFAYLTNEAKEALQIYLYGNNNDLSWRINDIAFQQFVFEHDRKDNRRIEYYLVLLNHGFIYDGKRDKYGDPDYGPALFSIYDVGPLLDIYKDVFKERVDMVIDRINKKDTSIVAVSALCERGQDRECDFVPVCFARASMKDSVFAYYRNRDRYAFYNAGYTLLTDVPKNKLCSEINCIQHDVHRTNTPYIDTEMLVVGLSKLVYPLYHLDFETTTGPLPYFSGEGPYAKSVFQFSLHIEKAPGVCDFNTDHVEYLATTHNDEREALVQKMCEAINEDGGSVVVFNKSFEQQRLRELALLFPAYAAKLNYIVAHLFDLLDIIRGSKELFNGSEKPVMYLPALYGSYSLKAVLPALTLLSYAHLNIRNGAVAASAYLSYPYLRSESRHNIQAALLEYCKLDTWAMVEILRALHKHVN